MSMIANILRFRILVGTFALMSILATNATAQLVITVDTAAQELTISGSTSSGTPSSHGGSFGRVVWEFGGSALSDTVGRLNSPTIYLTSSGSTLLQLDLLSDGTKLNFDAILNSTSNTMLTGTSTAFDYSGLDANVIAGLEGAIGETLTLSAIGTGYDNISIVAAVPEPAAAAAFFGGLALVGTVFARRRSRQA